MATSHTPAFFQRFPFALMIALWIATNMAYALELSSPVDVPDDVGLGERLALVSWLKDRQISIKDPQDLQALRLAYITRAHPEQLTPPTLNDDLDRGSAAAELYNKFSRNPPTGSSTEEIRALIAQLETAVATKQLHDQEEARNDALLHPRAQNPIPQIPHELAEPKNSDTPSAAFSPPTLNAGKQAPSDPAKEAERTAAGVIIGQAFPNIAGRTISRDNWDLSQWKGKVVLIDFWATWCGPCMRELPNVQSIYKTYHERGFEVIGISLDHDLEILRKTLTKNTIPWPQLCDGLGWNSHLAKKFAIHSIPSTFLISKDGTLLAADLRGTALASKIAQALNK